MNIKNLRKSILQYAVEGKLVQQDIHDEPASILYDKIIKEKENLINQGQIKKEKPLPPVTDDEIPYNIPENWKWVRLGEIIALLSGQDLKLFEINNEANGIPYITGASAIKEKKIVINRWTTKPIVISQKNDILITCKGTIGKVVINYTGDIHIARQIMNIKPFSIYNIYLYLFLLSYQKFFIEKGKSIIPGISRNDILHILFPLPPLKEQERIAKKVDELMALCDKLEQEEEKLLSLDKHFADNLPKSILQHAVEGKLVQQDIQDEPASILYDKIVKEKENLINQGQIKKEKPIPPVTDDEIPYNIPESWKWVRLGEVCNLINGNKTTNINLPLLNAKYLRTRQEKQIYNEGIKVNKNDYIILVDGENSGEVFKAFEDGILGSTFKILNINSNIFENYILHILYFYKNTFKKQKKGAAIPHLDKELFKNILIPLPPLKEQGRIVKKVDELLTYYNKLKDII